MRDFPARHSFSSTSSAGTDLGAANPTAAVVPEPGLSDHQLHGKHRRIVSALETDEVKELWRCMVELQERYGCYRSARMQAVVSAPRPTELMPSRACLDLLNDDVAEELPEEAWQMLGRFAVEE